MDTSLFAQAAAQTCMTVDFSRAHLAGFTWPGHLPETLLHLCVDDAGHYFAAGLARAVARCCPRLESLQLSVGFMRSVSDRDTAAALAGMLPSLRALRSLSLADVWLSAEAAAAVAALPALLDLSLCSVEADPAGLAALAVLGGCSLRSLSVTNSMGAHLPALLRGMAAAGAGGGRCLTTLHLELPHRRGPAAGTCEGGRLAAALAELAASAPLLEHLSVTGDYRDCEEAALIGLASAAAAARGTLRTLHLAGMRPRPRAEGDCALFYQDFYARLSACARLERLSLDDALGSLDAWHPGALSRRDVRLAALVGTVAAAAPRLGTLRTGCFGCQPARLSADTHPALPRTVAAVARVEAARMRDAGRAAWAVVCAGIVGAQERRVREAKRPLPQGARPPRPATRAPLATLPASVLRDLGAFLSDPVPLEMT